MLQRETSRLAGEDGIIAKRKSRKNVFALSDFPRLAQTTEEAIKFGDFLEIIACSLIAC